MVRNSDRVRISKVSFEHHTDALGIGESEPRISWRFEGTGADWVQSSYEIEIKRGESELVECFVVLCQESTFVSWPSSPLASGERAAVRVRAFSNQHGPTPWSESASVETGLLSSKDWTSYCIEPAERDDKDRPHRPIIFRRQFHVNKHVVRARLYITAHGIYEAKINGKIVGDHVFAPGWTSYQHELPYQTFDVRPHLHKGMNVIAAQVAEGWYSGKLGFNGGNRNIWGDTIGFIAQLHLTYENGITDVIETDSTWKYHLSAIISAEIYDGECYDATKEHEGWSTSKFDDVGWLSVQAKTHNTKLLRAPDGPPIRRVHELPAVRSFISPSKKTIIDFGQNIVGWVRLRVQGTKGQIVRLKHAEALENNEIVTKTLRFAKATDTITLSGKPIVWEPRFTFHGFRYVQVENMPTGKDGINLKDFTAVVIYTDMERTGWFECSDPMLNRLHDNVLWSMRGNFVGVPTDCPQRDERLGYTGDLQAFAPTAIFLYNPYGLLKTWLRTLAMEQKEEGNGVPGMFAPNCFRFIAHQPCAIWGDATIIAPWDLYRGSGDSRLLKDQYESMVDWLDNGITRDSRGLWDPSIYQLGDWLDPRSPDNDAGNGSTDSALVANAYLIRITDIMAKICDVISLPLKAEVHRTLAASMRHTFCDEYISKTGRVVSDSQTAFALAIHFSLFAPNQIETATTRLKQIIATHDYYRIGTGFVGTPIIGHALTAVNETQLFYRMLLGRECPSWLYPITMGATTIWERWDSMLPNGQVNGSGMTSFNHYALGSVADWMHKVIGGLSALEPGWKHILIRPIPGGNLTRAKVSFLSPYGLVESRWRLEGGVMTFRAVVPPNTKARIELPSRPSVNVGSGVYEIAFEYMAPAIDFGIDER